jgi:uncharacterized radical SAM superfamily protein
LCYILNITLSTIIPEKGLKMGESLKKAVQEICNILQYARKESELKKEAEDALKTGDERKMRSAVDKFDLLNTVEIEKLRLDDDKDDK